MIRLEEVNPENWRLGLNVSETQKRFVAGGQPCTGQHKYKSNQECTARDFMENNQ